MLHILDTDHISLFQHGNRVVTENLSRLRPAERAVTIISFAEQVQGRLAVLRRARTEVEAQRACDKLRETLEFYSSVHVLSYDDAARENFERERSLRSRIGTQDFRIASIALSQKAIVVTRNSRDFKLVPGLQVVDWSVEPQG